MKKSQPVLRAEELEIGYLHKDKKNPILSNINFEISQAELIGVIGVNGIGKSTLLRTLSGLQPALSGEVFLNDIELRKTSANQRAKNLSLVLTEKPVSQNLKVWELVALGRQPYTNWLGTFSDQDRSVVNKSLDIIDITNLAHKKCYELSDGQLQKVMIARALAQETNLIILDEPTTHLDLYHQAYVFKTLQKLSSDQEKAILFSTHEVNLALEICDKILILQENSTHFDTPKNLIQQEILSTIFPKELIYFDKNSRSFRIKSEDNSL